MRNVIPIFMHENLINLFQLEYCCSLTYLSSIAAAMMIMSSSMAAPATVPTTIPVTSPPLRLLSGSGGGIKAMNAALNPASSNMSLFV